MVTEWSKDLMIMGSLVLIFQVAMLPFKMVYTRIKIIAIQLTIIRLIVLKKNDHYISIIIILMVLLII